jgi:hypothetical protein
MCSLLDVVSRLTLIRPDLSVVGLSSTCCSVARPRKMQVIDIHPPTRQDLMTGLAKDVQFMQGDIADGSLVEKSFKAPWPDIY